MSAGFPVQVIPKLCCNSDGAALELGQNCQLSECGGFVRFGTLHCSVCKADLPIDDGILDLQNAVAMDHESSHEQQLRNEKKSDAIKAAQGEAWWENDYNRTEMIPTLEAMAVSEDATILELGCGDGRYTTSLAARCQWIVAIDFSVVSLRVLQQRLKQAHNVALVLGDVTTMKVKAGSFDHVLSTLVSNLPTLEHRNAMYRLAANALGPGGRFTFSTHNHGFRQKLRGEKKSGRYRPGGIYRYHFTLDECKAEVRPYFKAVKARRIQIRLPFAGRLRLPSVALSRVLERVPLINGLGDLILCTAEQPVPVDSNRGNA